MAIDICGFAGLSKEENGLNFIRNKIYASVIKMIVRCIQHRQISQTSFKVYPNLAPDKPGLR